MKDSFYHNSRRETLRRYLSECRQDNPARTGWQNHLARARKSAKAKQITVFGFLIRRVDEDEAADDGKTLIREMLNHLEDELNEQTQ